jgi:Domain of unknown function (DUF4232)
MLRIMRLPTLPSARLTILAATTCLAGGGAFGALVATQPAAAASTPRCSTAGLVVWLNTQGSGAAGSVFYQLRLTNLSGHACTLAGYPGVSATSLTSRQLGRGASREGGSKAHTVTLSNGASASATLRIVEAGNFPSAGCKPTLAAGLKVYPPNQRTAKIVPFPFEACSGSGPVFLTVGPLRRS